MNKLFLSVLVASFCLALVTSFTVVPKATTMMRGPMAPQQAPAVAPLNVMMVDMTGGALADVSPIGSIIMFVAVIALWEVTFGGASKK